MPELIECSGAPYEMGRQYAEQAGDDLMTVRERLYGLFVNSGLGLTEDDLTSLGVKFLPQAQAFDPEVIDFVRGKADSLRLPFGEVFTLHSIIELAHNLSNVSAMCTSLALSGRATREGESIVAQNVDWHPEDPVHILRLTFPDGFRRFSICLAGNSYYHLTSTGIANCANLTVSSLTVPGHHVPLGLYLWRVMRQPDIESSIALLKQVARGFGYYHLADEEGRIVGIESTMDDYELLSHPEVLVHANHYCTDRLSGGDIAPTHIPCSFRRFARMQKLVEENAGASTPESVMSVLRDHEDKNESICRHADRSTPSYSWTETRMAFVMLPGRRSLFACFGPPCRGGIP